METWAGATGDVITAPFRTLGYMPRKGPVLSSQSGLRNPPAEAGKEQEVSEAPAFSLRGVTERKKFWLGL